MARPRRNIAAAVQNKAVEAAAEVVASAKAAAPRKTAVSESAAAAECAAAAVKAEPERKVVVEFGGKQLKIEDIMAQAEKAYADARTNVEIKSVELYISPEQNAAYYVVNGEASEDFKIEL